MEKKRDDRSSESMARLSRLIKKQDHTLSELAGRVHEYEQSHRQPERPHKPGGQIDVVDGIQRDVEAIQIGLDVYRKSQIYERGAIHHMLKHSAASVCVSLESLQEFLANEAN